MTPDDLRWPLIISNDLQLRAIFCFGRNSVLNFHGLDLLHIKMKISQLMVELQPTILVNTGIHLMKFKLFISANSAGLLMVIMKERSPNVIFTGSVTWTTRPVWSFEQTVQPSMNQFWFYQSLLSLCCQSLWTSWKWQLCLLSVEYSW